MTDPHAPDLHGPMLVLIRGLYGSGKTYLANTLQGMIGADKVVLLDPDTIDLGSSAYQAHTAALTEQGVEEKFHPYRFLLARMHDAILAHKIIFWNQPFSDLGGFQRTIENARNFAAEHNLPLPVVLVEVETSPEVAKARLAERKARGGHGPSLDRFESHVQTFASFAGQGTDATIAVSGEDDVALSAAKVIQRLQQVTK